MLEPWNNALLAPPPVNTFLCKDLIDISKLRSTLEDVSQILSNQSPLHQEGAVISRLIYKFDKKFRNDIGYRNLKKVNTALKRYMMLNLAKVIDDFYSVIPTLDSDDYYLPTRQMLEYVLVRLQSFCKLMVRICICTKKSAIFYWDRVTRGESHWMSVMPYAVVCRVWSLCLVLLKQSCTWYTRLYEYTHKLQLVGLHFLPEGYSLPADIEQWLDFHNLDEYGKFNWSKNKCIDILSSLEEDDSEESLTIFQYIQNVKTEMNELEFDNVPIDDDSSGVREKELEKSTFESANLDTEYSSKKHKMNDIGESISWEYFTNLARKEIGEGIQKSDGAIDTKEIKKDNKKKSVHPSNQTHSTDTVTNVKEIKVFVAKEDRLRNNGNKQSLSNHLSFMQWQSLKIAVNNLFDAGLSDEVICKKFKKLWKNRCIDCL